MAIIVGGNPRVEREAPQAAPESKIKRDVKPTEVRKDDTAQSEEPVKKSRRRKTKSDE